MPSTPRPPSLGGLLTAVVATLAWCVPSAAQDAPLILEVQGGVALPFGDLRDGTGPGMGVEAGPSLSLVFARPSDGWRTIYAGFSQHRFGCEAAGCDSDGRYVATGFNAGLRVVVMRRGPVVPWLRVGGITMRVETGDLAATPLGVPDAGVSKLGFGGEAGVGVLVRFNRSWGWSTTALASTVDSELPGGSTLPMRWYTVHSGVTLLF